MVVFKSVEPGGRCCDAEKTAQAICKAKIVLGHKPEFHFSQCSHKVRSAFFNQLNADGCGFDVYALVVDKQKITSNELKKSPAKFYNFMLKQLLSHNPIKSASIKIDGQKNKKFRQALAAYLRHENPGVLKKLKFVDSHKDDLVQLADMVCSAIHYAYSRHDKLNAAEYKNKLGKRIKNIWEFK